MPSPFHKMKGVVEVGAASASALFGGGIERAFSGAITFCLLSVISAMVMAGPTGLLRHGKGPALF